MAPKTDQFFKEKFSKYLQEKNDNDEGYSDDEYDTEDNLAGRLGGLGIPHDDDLDVPPTTFSKNAALVRGASELENRTGLGSLGGRSLGGRGLGGRGLGGLGGRTLGGLGGLGGSRGGMTSRSGLGGLGRGRTSQSLSSSDNQRVTGLESRVSTDVPTSTSNIGDISKALGDIAKGTTALQKEVSAFISDSQQKNVEAFKEILHFVHGLSDKTVVHFKELSRFSKTASLENNVEQVDEKPVDEALQALLTNIDKRIKDDTAYILLPTSNNVDVQELSKLLGIKNVQLVNNVRGLCDKIMSEQHVSESEDKPTSSLPVQVAHITPTSSPSKGFPPLRSPIIK